MSLFVLTVSLSALGLPVVQNQIVKISKRRLLAVDAYPPTTNLYTVKSLTNVSGVATCSLDPDDASTYHELEIYNSSGVVIYSRLLAMPTNAVALEDISTNTEAMISATASAATATTQAGIATAQAVISTAQAVIATTKASEASASASTATTQAGIATAQAVISTAQAVIATEQAAAATATVGASSNIQILNWAYVQAFAITSATRNGNDVITTASIVWPDGATGTFTTDTINTTYNAIDAWHATHILDAVTKTVTQTAVTRNASGAVTAQPIITIS